MHLPLSGIRLMSREKPAIWSSLNPLFLCWSWLLVWPLTEVSCSSSFNLEEVKCVHLISTLMYWVQTALKERQIEIGPSAAQNRTQMNGLSYFCITQLLMGEQQQPENTTVLFNVDFVFTRNNFCVSISQLKYVEKHPLMSPSLVPHSGLLSFLR